MARIGAQPGDWKTNPLPDQVTRLAYTRRFTSEELGRLQRGLIPEQMEDKWFIVWHDAALWMHRSWTGLCVFRVRFLAQGDGYVVDEAVVNRDPQQYSGQDVHDVSMLDNLLTGLLSYSARHR